MYICIYVYIYIYLYVHIQSYTYYQMLSLIIVSTEATGNLCWSTYSPYMQLEWSSSRLTEVKVGPIPSGKVRAEIDP